MGACGSLPNEGTDPTFDNRTGAPVKKPTSTQEKKIEPMISAPFNVNLGLYTYNLDYGDGKVVPSLVPITTCIDLSDQIIIRPSHLPKVERQLGIKIDSTVADIDGSQHRRKSSDSSVTYIYNSDDKEIQQIINEEKYCISVLRYNQPTAV